MFMYSFVTIETLDSPLYSLGFRKSVVYKTTFTLAARGNLVTSFLSPYMLFSTVGCILPITVTVSMDICMYLCLYVSMGICVYL